jgi:hypothetical protein
MQRIEKRVARANAKLPKDAPCRKQSSYYGNRNLVGLERTSGERSPVRMRSSHKLLALLFLLRHLPSVYQGPNITQSAASQRAKNQTTDSQKKNPYWSIVGSAN